MTTWQEAIASERDRSPVVLPIQVINTEYLRYTDEHPQSGLIEQCPDGEHFDVANAYTHEKREGVAEDQVGQALLDLDIANSDWI
jgi:hypothetical protein